MATATIPIKVDAQAAQAFLEAPDEDRRRLELLLDLRLRELVDRPVRPLREIMDEIGRKAEERGLTAAMLREMLQDD